MNCPVLLEQMGRLDAYEKINNQPNELLEVINGERVDTGTTQEAIRSDTAMAALE
jgi:hypothetical protein